MMKSWEQYAPKTPDPRPEYDWEIEKRLIKEIDEKPLTKRQREDELAGVKRRSREMAAELWKDIYAQKSAAAEQFWIDAREELRYDSWLDEEGVSALEGFAYDKGHAYGFPEIFSELQDATHLAEKIQLSVLRNTVK